MKKRIIAVSMLAISSLAVFAGGILTNSNQSASYVRMISRFGSTDMDAVYYNPAGLTNLNDGWNLSLNNQSLFQTRTINCNAPYLNGGDFKEYEGKVTVPSFPSGYIIYKKGNFAYSLGVNPIGGGGASEFKTGLPMFEVPISNLPTIISGAGMKMNAGMAAMGQPAIPNFLKTTTYNVDMNLTGSSMYLGYQGGVSYKASDIVSIFGGLRVVQAINSYEGEINDIEVNTFDPYVNKTSAMVNANEYFTKMSTTYPAAFKPTFEQLAGNTSNKALDCVQTGLGLTPIIGINFNFTEKLNLGLRYEFETKVELTNDTEVNSTGLAQYDDGVTSRADMPATFSAGAQYKVLPKLRLALGGQYYFDKNTNYNGRETLIDDNSWELSLGGEYDITEKILVSAGYLRFQTGVSEAYQNDISHSVSTNTIGLGGAYKFNEKMKLNIGVLYTVADTYKVSNTDPTLQYNYETKYDRKNLGFAIGFDVNF